MKGTLQGINFKFFRADRRMVGASAQVYYTSSEIVLVAMGTRMGAIEHFMIGTRGELQQI